MQVRNLASTVLTRIRPRLPDDWQARYGYRPVPLETFVQSGRFAGTSYCAANLETVAARKPTHVDNYRIGAQKQPTARRAPMENGVGGLGVAATLECPCSMAVVVTGHRDDHP